VGTVTINGYLGSYDSTTTATSTAKSIAADINANAFETGVTASAITEASVKLSSTSDYSFDITSDNSTAVTVSFSVGAGQTADDYAAGINAINALASKTGVTAEYDQTNQSIKLTNATGNDITIDDSAAVSTGTVLEVATYEADGTTLTTANDSIGAVSVANGQVTLDSSFSFSLDDTTAASGFAIDGGAASASTLLKVADLDVTTFADAQDAIKIVDSALAAVNNQRAKFGALQSRFENTVTNLQTTSENLSASRSRIRDADFAEETAKLARNQVIQQAGLAMLSQANALPQNVLSLLR
jgi:flagellin